MSLTSRLTTTPTPLEISFPFPLPWNSWCVVYRVIHAPILLPSFPPIFIFSNWWILKPAVLISSPSTQWKLFFLFGEGEKKKKKSIMSSTRAIKLFFTKRFRNLNFRWISHLSVSIRFTFHGWKRLFCFTGTEQCIDDRCAGIYLTYRIDHLCKYNRAFNL